MDKLEAKKVLQALHATDSDSTQPAVVEAMALVAKDRELRAWWEAQQTFDKAVSKKLREIEVPEDLRATIIAGRKIEQFRPRRFPQYTGLAAAAAVAIFCALGTSQYLKKYGPQNKGDYVNIVIPLLNNDAPSLAMTSEDRGKIQAWLKENNAPMGDLPPKITALSPIGCQKYMVHGHPVSLMCFVMPDGGEAHLFTVEENALKDPPGARGPEWGNVNGWSTAAWSDGKMSYVICTQCPVEELKKLL